MDKGDRAGLYLAPPSGRWHPPGSLSPAVGDAGAIRYLGYADESSPEPVETLTIEAGQFGVFPPEKWHCIEALSEDTVFNVDFYVDPNILIEG
ncbi:putative tellurite resistance protein [Klebsiella quasipneumoniae]|nr:putative tellurite resistance protein [Klebsiella quasipneumoniae]